MATIRALLPDAWVCVDEREAAEYKPACGDRLVLHPPTTNNVQVRNWIIDHFQSPCLVMIDDDLRQVRLMVTGKRTKDPADIRRIIENSAAICADVGLTAFCWNRNAAPIYFRDFDPL